MVQHKYFGDSRDYLKCDLIKMVIYHHPINKIWSLLMLVTWIIRIAILLGSFALHWGFGVFMLIGLFFHMHNKASAYNRRFNLGGNIPGPDGRPIRAPWYLF